jgi:hypothetical protein
MPRATEVGAVLDEQYLTLPTQTTEKLTPSLAPSEDERRTNSPR